MDHLTLTAFMDELTKIAAKSNAAAPFSMKTGMGNNTMVSSSSSGKLTQPKASFAPAKSNAAAKSTNYSIVHSEAPPAAYGMTASTSKAVPPPPVRT